MWVELQGQSRPKQEDRVSRATKRAFARGEFHGGIGAPCSCWRVTFGGYLNLRLFI